MEKQQNQKEFYKEYNRYTLALEKVLKVFYEKNPKLNNDLEENIFKSLRKIAADKSSLNKLLQNYNKNQPDKFYKEKLSTMSEELDSTFFLNDIFMKAYKYLEMKNKGRVEYLKTKEDKISDYKLKEFEDKPEEIIKPKQPEKLKTREDITTPDTTKPEENPKIPEPEKVINKIKIKTAFIAYSEELAKVYARDMAERKLSHDYTKSQTAGF
jgi:hypothetical protein